jgi:hypothetical protein
MRRLTTALALAASALLSTSTTHAATARPVHLVSLVSHLHRLGSALPTAAKAERAIHTEKRISHAMPQQTAQSMFLPSSAFSPAVINSTYTGTNSASDADQDWFRGNHSTNYESFGYITGAYQRADWSAPATQVIFRYQGSIMNSASGASNAWTDGVTYVQNQFGTSSSNCSNNTAVLQCATMAFNYTDSSNNSYTEEYDVLQYKQCLAEATADVPSAFVSGVANQIAQTMNNIDQAAVTAMANTCGSSGGPTPTPNPTPNPTPTPTTTDFSVISVRFEKNNLPPDYQLQNAPLTQVKAGTKVDASGYYIIRSAPSNTQVNSEFVVSYNGSTVLDKKYTEDYSGPDTYWTALKGMTLKKAGTYRLTITITVNGQRDSDTATISVKKKVAKVKKVSFTFNSLQTQGGSTFHVGQQIPVDIKYTVKNLKGHTTGTIIRSILAQIGGRWKAVNTSVIKTTVVKGANDTSVSAQFSAPGTFQIQVGVLIGSGKQQKTVSVNVR